ncbi:MAG: helix-turn-helix domain-containing protein [Lentihominibacter sp.]
MNFHERLAEARRARGLTQSEIAEMMDVSFQAVSLWERGESLPDTEEVIRLASALGVSIDWLLTGAGAANVRREKIFDEGRMYTYVKTYAGAEKLYQTSRVLPLVREVGDMYLPLLRACLALALGMVDDDMITVALLYDRDVPEEKLQVSETAGSALELLHGDGDVSRNPVAAMVRLLDCYAGGETKPSEEITALIREAKNRYPMYLNQLFLLTYTLRKYII